MNDKRESTRIKDSNQRRVLDPAARKRRHRKALEALEQDNFHDDPHANLVMHKKAPKFEESLDRTKRRRKSEHVKQRVKKTFAALIEEEQMSGRESPNYITAYALPSQFPERKFCAVCGFPSNYTCGPCGSRYCSVKCLGMHQDTRCLKWTA
uniref:HIT-type domain-containing protein n=1 Tax=Strigamia maritima TaxID=126957 RepID=T1JN43_STRMM